MKKYIYGLFMAAASLCVMNSCQEDEGQMPGNDSAPAVTIFQYDVDDNYDGDCDVEIGLYPNDKATEVAYIVEPVATKADRLNQLDEQGYAAYVAQNGTKVSCSVDNPAKVVLTKVFGEQAISAVAINGGKVSKAVETIYTGLEWQTLATGTYYCANANLGKPVTENVELQTLATDKDRFRFKNLYGKNKHLVFSHFKLGGAQVMGDNGGKAVRILAQPTNMTYGSYGTVQARDVAAWQSNEDYAEWNNFFEDYTCAFYIQYFVSAGSLGYGCDQFIPNAE